MVTRHPWQRMLVSLAGLLILAPQALPPRSVAAASLSFTVTSTSDAPDAHPGDGICATKSGQCTLRAAIQEADAQPVVSTIAIGLPAGTYVLALGPLRLTANRIAVNGAGSGTTTISGNSLSTVVSISSTVAATITGVTITAGNAGAGKGGGIYTTGSLILRTSAVSNNTASGGAGIFNAGQLWLIDGSVLSGNVATTGGGGLANSGIASITSSTITSNTAMAGGGLVNDGVATIAASTISGNVVPSSHSTATNAGGGLYNTGQLALSSSNVISNTAPVGGGIDNSGAMTLTHSTVSDNAVFYDSSHINDGGGLSNEASGKMMLSTSSVMSNTADNEGGGLANHGALTLANSVVAGNTAADGGAIFQDGRLDMINDTLSGNTATYGGGGIDTFGGRLSILYNTFSGNQAGYGEGDDLDIFHGSAIVTGTILASSAAAQNCVLGGSLSEGQGYNLDSGTTCGLSKTTDVTNTDPLLGPLADNGGPTQTMALLPGSPAIDHGGTSANGCPATDQRGVSRPQGPACDIGAYERVP